MDMRRCLSPAHSHTHPSRAGSDHSKMHLPGQPGLRAEPVLLRAEVAEQRQSATACAGFLSSSLMGTAERWRGQTATAFSESSCLRCSRTEALFQ